MPSSVRLYFDSCCFIDMAKQAIERLPDSARAKDVWYMKKLLEASRDRAVTVFTSAVTIAECTHADGAMTSDVKAIFTRLLTSGQYVTLVQPTQWIAEDARDLRWKHGINLRGLDSMHVASALTVGCTEFISTDQRISNQASKFAAAVPQLQQRGLRVLRAANTGLLPSSYLQENFLSGITPEPRT
jgi:hypothetical protein